MEASDIGVFRFGRFSVERAGRRLSKEGKTLVIGDRAFDVLLALLERPGETLSNAALAEKVWPGKAIDDGNVRVQISHLRKILGPDAARDCYIRNIAGRGYCLVTSAPPAPGIDSDTDTDIDAHAHANVAVGAAQDIVGREQDIDLIARLLAERRLVSIVGPGGVGKTTVATAIVHLMARRLTIDSAIVDFSTVDNPALVPSALAAAIGAAVLLRQPTESVVNALRGKRKLLLLDNCEHILDAAAALVESVRAVAPDTMVIVTSREPLRTEGEWVYRLSSLSPPPDAFFASPDRARGYAAVQLFVTRARAHVDGFALTPQNCRSVCTVCTMLDGLPLAIELAAAQVKFLGIDTLLGELQGGFEILDTSSIPAPRRHRTLTAMLDWSYDKLSVSEKAVLAALSAFRGRFDLAAAQAVACHVEADTAAFLEDFFHLIETSLISVGTDIDPPLYRLLDVTRDYATKALHASGKSATIRRRHARYCLEMLADKPPRTEVPVGAATVSSFQALSLRIIDDIRSALEWAFQSDDAAALACQLTIASASVWQQLALLSEYQQCAIRAVQHIQTHGLTLPEESLALLLAIGFTDAGGANEARDGSKTGQQAFRSALSLAEAAHATESQVDALYGLVVVQVKAGEYASAYDSLARLGTLTTESLHAAALHHRLLALVDAYSGNAATVLQHLETSRRFYKQLDDRTSEQLGRFSRQCALDAMEARVLWETGRPDDALLACDSAVERAIASGDPLSLCYLFATGACTVAAWAGNVDRLSAYTSIFRKTVDEQSLRYWEAWALTFEWGLQARYDPNDTWKPDLQHVRTFPPLQHEVLATLDPRLLTVQAIERAASGKAGFSVPEILRGRAIRLLNNGSQRECRQAESLIREAYRAARKNGAPSWALRAATSLLKVAVDADAESEAVDQLSDTLAMFSQGADTADHREATATLAIAHSRRSGKSTTSAFGWVTPNGL